MFQVETWCQLLPASMDTMLQLAGPAWLIMRSTETSTVPPSMTMMTPTVGSCSETVPRCQLVGGPATQAQVQRWPVSVVTLSRDTGPCNTVSHIRGYSHTNKVHTLKHFELYIMTFSLVAVPNNQMYKVPSTTLPAGSKVWPNRRCAVSFLNIVIPTTTNFMYAKCVLFM